MSNPAKPHKSITDIASLVLLGAILLLTLEGRMNRPDQPLVQEIPPSATFALPEGTLTTHQYSHETPEEWFARSRYLVTEAEKQGVNDATED